MLGVPVMLDGIFVLRDEIIVRQQCAAELLKPLGGQVNYLVNTARLTFILGLFSLQFRLNDHVSPPIVMRLFWSPFITSSMLI